MNATNAATSVDEKCHFKYVHAAWAIKDKLCACAWGLLCALCSEPHSVRGVALLTQPHVQCVSE